MTAPFRSSIMTVRPEWIDYNGHLNMAYYNVLFDHCADEVYDLIGFGPDYHKTTGNTTYVAEFHLAYVRELHVNDPVTVTFQLIDFDSKRFHSYQEIWHQAATTPRRRQQRHPSKIDPAAPVQSRAFHAARPRIYARNR